MSGFDIFINFVEQLIIFIFIARFCKLNNKFNYVYFTVFILLGTVLMTFSNFAIGLEGYFKIVFISLNFVFCLIFTDNFIGEKIFVSFLPYVIISLINGFLTITTSYLLFNQLNSIELAKTCAFFWLIILSKILLFFTLSEIAYQRKKYENQISNNQIIYLVILIVFIQLIFIFIESIIYTNSINPLEIMITVFLLFIFMVLIIVYFFDYLKKNEIEQEKILNYQMLEFENRRYHEIELNSAEISKLKHNLKHILLNVLNDIDNNEISDAKNSIVSYLDEVNLIHSYGKFNSRILDFLINKFTQEAKEKGYIFNFSVNLVNEVNISDNDYMVLLGNALENSVLHSVGDKKIELIIEQKNNYAFFTLKNRVDSSMKPDDLMDSKRGNNHGYGIKTIKEIAAKYNGSISYVIEDEFLICSIVIPLK
ncbi:GHKL domain-containing protein [Anaerorhabdus furcosa]|uniref:Sensor histidine kinase YesM n=1 Tax=Anaerorhabdus furcosa TaxID=118967 RepID=A0A1T4PE74_9FIRM|nr:GHKL domain-containing protein [Anaerorhabdus furcosa]SJZ89536.1 Sensor histidine kinase YesM [Anaerorhabdus furcosa]